jgi:hypothetical protein
MNKMSVIKQISRKKSPRNPVRNGFLGPKIKFLKTGICNLVAASLSFLVAAFV